MRPELPSLHSVQSSVQKRWTRLAALASHIDAEASHHHPASRNQDGNGLGWRNIRIEREIDTWPAMEIARNLRPLSYGSEAIAHLAEMET
jgi:hypothetical protein